MTRSEKRSVWLTVVRGLRLGCKFHRPIFALGGRGLWEQRFRRCRRVIASGRGWNMCTLLLDFCKLSGQRLGFWRGGVYTGAVVFLTYAGVSGCMPGFLCTLGP